MDRTIILALLSALVILLLAAPIEATITSVQLVDVNGYVKDLNHDSQTQSYADGSLENPNIFVKICSNDASNDLLNKFIGMYYKISSYTIDLHVLPAKILSVDASGCAFVDLDVNFFKARYAGIPQIAISNSSDLSSPTFWPLSLNNGYMKGNFTLKYFQESSNQLNVTVTHALDESNNDITTNKKFILVGLLNSSGYLLDVKQVGINESVLMNWDGNSNFSFVINGISLGRTFCSQGQTLCDDGVCRETCTPMGCIGASNGICEIGEGCACSDCIGEQDSCEPGLICLNTNVCGVSAPTAPTGAVFGVRAPFECTWSSSYDKTVLPGDSIRLLYFHECTLLREVLINVSKPLTAAKIKTYGNESMFTKPVIPPKGYVFGYFKFEHNIPVEKFDKVTIQFKVPKTQLTKSGIKLEDISLQRFVDGEWIKLITKFTSEDNEYYYFEGLSPTLSLFAIVGEEVEAVAPTPPPPQPPPTPPVQPTVTHAFPNIPTAILLGILLVIIIILSIYKYTHKPAAITLPPLERPARPLQPAELSQKIAGIKQAFGQPTLEQPYRIAQKQETYRPTIKQMKQKTEKKIEKKFYKALGKVEKSLR